MKKKNVIGALIMAGLILVSVPLGAGRSLSREREKALENSYYYDSTGYAIYEGLEQQETSARNLITVAERYVDREPGLDPYIDELTYRADYCENFMEDGDPQEVECHWYLLQAAQELSQQLEQVELEEKDQKYPRQLIADMEAEQDKLMRSSYNDDARRFNEKLSGFPVRFLNKLVDVEPLGVFGEPSSWSWENAS